MTWSPVGGYAVVDAAGAAKALVEGFTGLTGRGNPLTNGVHLSRDVRSSHQGPVASVEEIPPRVVDDGWDDARVSFAVRAVGSEEGARWAAGEAARQLLTRLLAVGPWPVDVTVKDGARVRVLRPHSPEGPTLTGDNGGQVTYRVDITLRCQLLEDI